MKAPTKISKKTAKKTAIVMFGGATALALGVGFGGIGVGSPAPASTSTAHVSSSAPPAGNVHIATLTGCVAGLGC